jgi:arsenate reductase-like glutaredoxin family protein
MSLTIIVRATDSIDQTVKDVLSSLRTHIDVAMRQAAPAIRKRIQDTCTMMIKQTEEYSSLLSGELLAELGIPDVNRRLEEILKTIRNDVEVIARPVTVKGNTLDGGMSIGIIRSDFSSILGLPASEYISNQKYRIPWLEWLIAGGDQILVLDYAVTYAINAEQRIRSRTGLALMVPGSGWRVDPRYSGTIGDNFITRAFDGNAIKDYVEKIVREELQQRI